MTILIDGYRFPAFDEGARFPIGPRPPVWGEPGHEPWQRFPGPVNPTLPLPNPTPRSVDPDEIFGFPLAGRFGLLAQMPKKLTPVQAAAKNFGDIPLIGPLLNTIRDYEDRINYRNADPEIRRLLGLE